MYVYAGVTILSVFACLKMSFLPLYLEDIFTRYRISPFKISFHCLLPFFISVKMSSVRFIVTPLKLTYFPPPLVLCFHQFYYDVHKSMVLFVCEPCGVWRASRIHGLVFFWSVLEKSWAVLQILLCPTISLIFLDRCTCVRPFHGILHAP